MVHDGAPFTRTAGISPFSTRSIRDATGDCPNAACERTKISRRILEVTDFMITPISNYEEVGHTDQKRNTCPRLERLLKMRQGHLCPFRAFRAKVAKTSKERQDEESVRLYPDFSFGLVAWILTCLSTSGLESSSALPAGKLFTLST